ncbi:YozQ family protein [Gorillibacterium sp. sgz5001074]|uniref:YozQ family protein n=1 Tax=Gorillibacterium sp. sgz5001074 TaxID=3446695 RepID=UPI003F67AA9C
MDVKKQQAGTPLPDTTNMADHQYSVEDYEGGTQLEQGTAETHEMVSDVYMTGNNADPQNQDRV